MMLQVFNKNGTYIQHASLGITTPTNQHTWHYGTSIMFTSGQLKQPKHLV